VLATDGGHLAAVTLVDRPAQIMQAGGGAEVVAGVAALVEQGHEDVPGGVPHLPDAADPGALEGAVGPLGDGGGDAGAEQGGGEDQRSTSASPASTSMPASLE
jgi:hypothetical protein